MPRSSNHSKPGEEAEELPLSALLSQAFVAFTIEFDNEFEHRVPHRTTNHGFTPGHPRAPWLVSMAMWNNYLQYVPEEGIAAGDLQRLLGISNKGMQVWLKRLGRGWSYVRLDPPPAEKVTRIAPETRIGWTAGGLLALRAWRPLTAEIEGRWRERFGAETFALLLERLRAVYHGLDAGIPDFFTVLEYDSARRQRTAPQLPLELVPIPRLLAKALKAWAREFEGRTGVPLEVCANLLCVCGDEGVRLRDLPGLTHLSVEGVAGAIRGAHYARPVLARVAPAPGRGKLIVPTPAGMRAREQQRAAEQAIDRLWRERLGEVTVSGLRSALERIAAADANGEPALRKGLAPYPDCWRASLPPLAGLPRFPMVSHRGGFPDGS